MTKPSSCQKIYQLSPGGKVTVAASGLTAILGVDFDGKDRLYALETATIADFPGPAAVGSGKVVRVSADSTLTTIAIGLTFPTVMAFDPSVEAL
jgi:hypothetical protein